MPPSSLETLSRLNISYPMLFKLEVRLNQAANRPTNWTSMTEVMILFRIEAKSDKRTLVFSNLSPKKEKFTFLAG
jgi:hypothetical protein